MESYRVYKSLPVDDFMEMTSFVMAKVNLDLCPLIQETNFFRSIENHTDEYIKEYFIAEMKRQIEEYQSSLTKEMNILDMDKYYLFTPVEKYKLNDRTQIIINMCKEEIPRQDVLMNLADKKDNVVEYIKRYELKGIFQTILDILTGNYDFTE